MRRLVSCLLVGMMSAILFTGCVGKTNTPENSSQEQTTEEEAIEHIQLKVWCPQNQLDSGLMEDQQRDFEELHPEWNISWTTEVVGEDKAKENILKDVEAAADVFLFSSDQLRELAEAGAIARLGGSAEEMVRNTMSEEVAATAMVDDALYGIPFTHNTFYMYYDKTLLQEEDVVSLEKIMAKETAKDVYNFYFESAGGWKLGAFYYGAGLNIFGENGEDPSAGVDWNNEKGVMVTEYLIDLINNPKCAYEGEISVTELISEHKLGAWFDGAWNDQVYEDILGDNLGRAILPVFQPGEEEYQLRSFYGSKCIGVNVKSDHMEAAVAFATFLGTEENQMLRFEKSSQIPTNQNISNQDVIREDALAAVVLRQVEEASVVQPASAAFGSRYWNYANTIPTEIRSGILNKENVKDKLDAFASAMTAD